MVDPYVLGWIICAVLSLVALRNFAFARKNRCHSSETDATRRAENVTTAAGECRSSSRDGDVDVIIVGAGVAGSALAHTLGKVFWNLISPFCFDFDACFFVVYAFLLLRFIRNLTKNALSFLR